MAEFRNKYFGRQIEAIGHESSRLALACDIALDQPGLAERILKGDDSMCRRKNEAAFRHRRLLGGLGQDQGGVGRRIAVARITGRFDR